MKKHLVALAATGLLSQVHADVEVAAGLKLFGVLDQGIMRQSVKSASSTVRAYSNQGFYAASATSRFGVKGERDLGDGVKAMIQFEQELAPDDSTLMPTKNRGTFVGLESEAAGAVRLGTQETPAYVMFGSDANGRAEYKPQVWRFLAGSDTQDRANNAVKYTSPKFGPMTVDVMRGYGETNVGNTSGTPQTNEFKSVGVNFSQGPLMAKAVVDSTSYTALEYALPGEVNKGVLNTTGAAQNKTTMIAKSATAPLTRQFIAVTYDLGVAKFNYIMANASTTGKGEVKTNTLGVRIPMDNITWALSHGTGNYNNAAVTGTATVAGSFSDTTLGVYYYFDKATSAYLLSSTGKNKPSVTTGSGSTALDAGSTGESQTSTIGLRYNY